MVGKIIYIRIATIKSVVEANRYGDEVMSTQHIYNCKQEKSQSRPHETEHTLLPKNLDRANLSPVDLTTSVIQRNEHSSSGLSALAFMLPLPSSSA